jgi:hypothetical protein
MPLTATTKARCMSNAPEGKADEARQRRSSEKIQRQLDEALADSFPASDPVSIVTSNEEEDWGSEPMAPAHKPAGSGR